METDESKIAEKMKVIDDLQKKAKRLIGGRLRSAEYEEANREGSRIRQAARTRKGQDIGPIPEVSDANWNRRLRCLADPELMFRTYWGFDPFFSLPFSLDHQKVIAKAEDVTRNGGNAAYAMSRGAGKTTLARAFSIRGILSGVRRFAFFIGAADPHARRSLATIKRMLCQAPLLLEDFPEIVFPLCALEGTAHKQGGQRCMEELTGIYWGTDYIRLPTCPPQKSIRPEQGAGYAALAMCSGLLGSGITGMNVVGERPDLVIADDVQTRQSARSDMQSAQREDIINSIIQGIAAPGTRLAFFMPCTIIRENDTSSRFLDHSRHPEFAIERCKMLAAMPTRMDLWEANRSIRTNFDPYAGPGDKQRATNEATVHYIDNQAAMDEGAVPSWKERFNQEEVSAVQHAMNKYADDRISFFAEMQNDPLPGELGNVVEMTSAELKTRLSGRARLIVPHGAQRLTAFVDVQGIGLLFYAVCAWRDDFTGWLIDYGTSPSQGRNYFTKATAPALLPPGDAALHKGISDLCARLLTTEYRQENGAGSQVIDLCLIDSGHQAALVYEVCRQLRAGGFGNRVMPSKGEGTRATDPVGFTEGAKVTGEKRGFGWKLPPAKETRGIKLLRIDVNAWKTFVWDRFAVEGGAKGSLTLFGTEATNHLLLIDHLFAEYRQREKSERTGREIDEWHARPNQDNDYLDCVVGAAVAASVQGSVFEGLHTVPVKPKVVDYAEMYAKARGR